MLKTMLGIMHWNAVQDAELSGERQIEQRYSYFSKARGVERQKVKKSAGSDYWKRELVERSVDRKRQLGPELPDLGYEEVEKEIETTARRLEALVVFEEEEDMEEE